MAFIFMKDLHGRITRRSDFMWEIFVLLEIIKTELVLSHFFRLKSQKSENLLFGYN